jgi:hypothetical protein
LLFIVALAAPATAKDVRIQPYAAPEAIAPLTPEESATLERALNFDALTLTSRAPARSFNAAALAHPRDLDVRRSDHPDGSSTIAVARLLSRGWNVKGGAELGIAAAPPTAYEPDKPLPGAAKSDASNAAWASLGVTRFATVEARMEPGSEHGTLGATLEHSVPLGDDMSVTLHGRYAVSDKFAAPAEQIAAAPVLSNDRKVKLNIGSTGTTLSAGVSANSADPVTHNTLSADQRIYGPLHVTTAITDAGQPTSNKSVAAGLKLSW